MISKARPRSTSPPSSIAATTACTHHVCTPPKRTVSSRPDPVPADTRDPTTLAFGATKRARRAGPKPVVVPQSAMCAPRVSARANQERRLSHPLPSRPTSRQPPFPSRCDFIKRQKAASRSGGGETHAMVSYSIALSNYDQMMRDESGNFKGRKISNGVKVSFRNQLKPTPDRHFW